MGSHFTVKAPTILLVYLVALLVNLGGLTVSYELLEVYREPFFEIFFFRPFRPFWVIDFHWLPLTLIAVIRKYRFSPRFPIIFNNEKVENKTIDFWWLRQLISLSWKIAFFDFLYIFFLRGQNVPQNSHFTVIYRTLKVRYGKKKLNHFLRIWALSVHSEQVSEWYKINILCHIFFMNFFFG